MCAQSRSPNKNPMRAEYQEVQVNKMLDHLQEEISAYFNKSKENKAYYATLGELSDGTRLALPDIKTMLEDLKKEKIEKEDRETRYAHFKVLILDATLNSIEQLTNKVLEDIRDPEKSKEDNTALLKYVDAIQAMYIELIGYYTQIKAIFDVPSAGQISKIIMSATKYLTAQYLSYDKTAIDIQIYKVYLNGNLKKEFLKHAKIVSSGKPTKSVKINIPSECIEQVFLHALLNDYKGLENPKFKGKGFDFERIYVVDARDPAEVLEHGINYHLNESHNGKLINKHGHIIYFDTIGAAGAFANEHWAGETYDKLGGWRQKKKWGENDRAEVRENFRKAGISEIQNIKEKSKAPHHKHPEKHNKKSHEGESNNETAYPPFAEQPASAPPLDPFEETRNRNMTPKPGMNPAFFNPTKRVSLSAPPRSAFEFKDVKDDKDEKLQQGERTPTASVKSKRSESISLSREAADNEVGEKDELYMEDEPGLMQTTPEGTPEPDTIAHPRRASHSAKHRVFQSEQKGESEELTEVEEQPHKPAPRKNVKS